MAEKKAERHESIRRKLFMKNNDVITFDIEREALEYTLGYLVDAIGRLNQAQAVLRSVVCIIRMAMQDEDTPAEIARANASSKVISFPRDSVLNINRHEESKNDPESSKSEDTSVEDSEKDEMDSLIVNLLKTVFSALSYLVENEK